MKIKLIKSKSDTGWSFTISMAAITEEEKKFFKDIVDEFLPTANGIHLLADFTIMKEKSCALIVFTAQDYERLSKKSITFYPKGMFTKENEDG